MTGFFYAQAGQSYFKTPFPLNDALISGFSVTNGTKESLSNMANPVISNRFEWVGGISQEDYYAAEAGLFQLAVTRFISTQPGTDKVGYCSLSAWRPRYYPATKSDERKTRANPESNGSLDS